MDNQKEGSQKQLGSLSQEDGKDKLAFRGGSYDRVPDLKRMQNTSCKGKSELTASHFALSEYSEETEAEKCAQHILFISTAIYFSCHYISLGSWFSVWGMCMQ